MQNLYGIRTGISGVIGSVLIGCLPGLGGRRVYPLTPETRTTESKISASLSVCGLCPTNAFPEHMGAYYLSETVSNSDYE